MIKRVEIVVTALTDAANKKLDATLARKADLAKPVTFDVDADISSAMAKIAALRTAMGDEHGAALTMTLNTELNKASLVRAEQAARVFVSNSGGVTMPVYADMSQVSFERVRAAADLITSKPIVQQVVFDASTGSALRAALAGRAAAGAAGAAAGGGGGGRGLFGLGRVPLWGGAATISGLMMVAHAIVEVGAVLIPAIIAFGAFGIAGMDAAKGIYTHTQNALTAINAVGGKLPALSGGFAAVQNAVKPQVLTMFGMGLEALGYHTGAFAQLATGAGNALEQFGMRALMAWKSASASQFTHNAISDLQLLLHIAGNIGGVIGNLIKSVPGIAAGLFHVIDGVTAALEKITGSGVVQGLLKIAMGMHGLFIWGGLAATALMKLWPVVQRFGSKLVDGALALGAWAEKGVVAAKAGAGFDGVMAELMPTALGAFGVIAGGIGIVAAIAFVTNEASDATANWIAKTNANIAKQSTLQGQINSTGNAFGQFGAASQKISSTLDKNTTAWERNVIAVRHVGGEYGSQVRSVNELTGAQNAARVQAARLTDFQNTVASKFHLSSAAVDKLVFAMTGSKGATAEFFHAIATGKTSMSQAVSQIDAYILATSGMIPTTEQARAGLYAMQYMASDAATALQKVVSAEDQLMGLSTGFEGAQLSFSNNFKTLRKDAHAAGASFTGVNQASTTLQLQWENTLFPSLIQVKDGLLQAHASTKQMATVLSTDLAPAVKLGVLQNKAFRDQIYNVAHEAGYNGVNSIKALTAWIDKNKTSADKAARSVAGLAGSIGKIPSSYHSSIIVNGSGTWHVVGGQATGQGSPGRMTGANGAFAHGGRIPGGWGGGDRVHILAEPGEWMLTKHQARAIGYHNLANLPRYAQGGYVAGDYKGIPPNWPMTQWQKTLKQDESALAKTIHNSLTINLSALGGGRISGSAVQWIKEALAITHEPMSWLGILERLVSLESGGNPLARNASGASGLFQTKPGTFAAYGIGGSMWNPVADAVAGIRYLTARYGSPYNIPGLLSGHYNGYANGGWVNEPVFGVGLHSGEAYGFGERGSEYVSPHGGGAPVVINIYCHPSNNPNEVYNEVWKGLRDLKRNRGQNLGLG